MRLHSRALRYCCRLRYLILLLLSIAYLLTLRDWCVGPGLGCVRAPFFRQRDIGNNRARRRRKRETLYCSQAHSHHSAHRGSKCWKMDGPPFFGTPSSLGRHTAYDYRGARCHDDWPQKSSHDRLREPDWEGDVQDVRALTVPFRRRRERVLTVVPVVHPVNAAGIAEAIYWGTRIHVCRSCSEGGCMSEYPSRSGEFRPPVLAYGPYPWCNPFVQSSSCPHLTS